MTDHHFDILVYGVDEKGNLKEVVDYEDGTYGDLYHEILITEENSLWSYLKFKNMFREYRKKQERRTK